jgi:hypothetical protein
MVEEDFESKAHITKHLTGSQYDIIRERTRVNSWEEQDYINWKEFLASTLGVPFYKTGAKIYMGLKISKDGLSREEDVEVLKGMYEEQKGFYSGFPMVSDAIERAEEEELPKRRLKKM